MGRWSLLHLLALAGFGPAVEFFAQSFVWADSGIILN